MKEAETPGEVLEKDLKVNGDPSSCFVVLGFSPSSFPLRLKIYDHLQLQAALTPENWSLIRFKP